MTTHLTFKAAVLAAGLAVAGFAISPAFAQESEDGTIRLENVTIVEIVHVEFKPGKRMRAMEIIDEHFVPAGQAAGLPGPMHAFHFDTGKWDAIFVWEMEGGFDDLMWYRSPDDVAWFNALAEQEGGEEAAQAVIDEYLSSVANGYSEVGHVHNPEQE